MRKLIMWNMVTVDGFFEGPTPWDIGFHEDHWGDELEQLSIEQLHAADLILFGRVTYEGMAAYWPTAKGTAEGSVADIMNTIPKIVFSRTLASADWSNTRLVNTDASAEVARLKQQPGKDILLFGSADLASSLTDAGLIDEYRLGVNPVLLGSGNPLFKQGHQKQKLRLLDTRTLKTGVVILRYAI